MNGKILNFVPNLSLKEKYKVRMKILKKLIRVYPDVFILYKTAGLISEYLGNIKTALKFYLIFLLKGFSDLEFSTRYTILVFWCDTKYYMNFILLKLLIKYNLFHFEIILFKTKFLEQNNHIKQSAQIWKNLKKIYSTESRVAFRKKGKFTLYNYLRIFWIRIMAKCSDSKIFNLECLKLIDSYHYKYKKNELKIFYIILQILIFTILKININSNKGKNSKSFLDTINEYSSPYYVKIIKKFFENKKKENLIEKKNEYISFFSLNIKWFKNLSLGLNEKKRIFFFLFKEKSIHNYFLKMQESYNIFARLPKIKLNLLIKLAKIQKINKFLCQSLSSYTVISRSWIENIEPIIVITRILKKISKKKYSVFKQRLKTKIRKILIFSRKKYLKKTSLKNLAFKAENFFEKQKIWGLTRLILSIILIVFRNSLDLHKSTKTSHNNVKFFDLSNLIDMNSNQQKGDNDKNENILIGLIFLTFRNLVEMIYIFIFNHKVVFSNKALNFFIFNRFFFRKCPHNLKYIFLSLTFKNKKFKKAYEYSRILCLENPNSWISWCILSKIEKKIGIAVSKTLKFTLRCLSKFPLSAPAIVFAGNHCSVFGSHGYALAEYFQAYRWKKDSSFLNFSLHLQYLYRSFNRRNLNSDFSLLMSLCFFSNYKLIRFFSAEVELKRSKTSISLRMEVFYNKARLYLFLGMKYLALTTFKRVLTKKNSFLSINKRQRFLSLNKTDDLKNDSMFNIFLLYLTTGNKVISNQIKKKILI